MFATENSAVFTSCCTGFFTGQMPSFYTAELTVTKYWMIKSQQLLLLHYNRFTALCPGLPGWAGTRKKHLPTHLSWSPSDLYQLLPSTTILFNLHAWQSFCTTCLHVLFGLLLDLELSTSYSMHFFTQTKHRKSNCHKPQNKHENWV